VKNADRGERRAQALWIEQSNLQESGALSLAFLRFGIPVLRGS
jgi:hypothetical protein